MIDFELTVGDFLDRMSIAQIKAEKGRLSRRELLRYAHALDSLRIDYIRNLETWVEIERYLSDLIDINTRLWNVEDEIRGDVSPDKGYILALKVIELNDIRAKLKRDIDILVGDEYDAKVYAGKRGYNI